MHVCVLCTVFISKCCSVRCLLENRTFIYFKFTFLFTSGKNTFVFLNGLSRLLSLGFIPYTPANCHSALFFFIPVVCRIHLVCYDASI